MRYAMILTAVVGMGVMPVMAQESTPPSPGAAGPTTRPGRIDEAFQAEVIRVTGNVSYALVDEKGDVGQWRPAKVGDKLPAGTRIRTRLRAKVTLTFGDDTVVEIDRVTMASIDEFHRTGDTKRVKLGLGHGMIRGGVAETTLRSDMTIETPTATLSKRGTVGFGIEYQPVTGRFRIFLEKEGLIEALNKTTGQSRYVGPGQYVTEKMIEWIQTATFDRWVPIVDIEGMSDAEQLFNALQDSGLGVVEPGGGSELLTFSGRDMQILAAQLAEQRRQEALPRPGARPQPTGRYIDRPEGNFGTGSGP